MGEVVNGETILAKVVETYASFDTYSDIGTVESSNSPGPKLEFYTEFKRPLSFRFHWDSVPLQVGKNLPAKETTIWSDGEHFVSLFQGEYRTVDQFSLLVAGATGISRGAVHVILNILTDNSVKLHHPWHEMSEVRRLDDEADFYRIIGTSRGVDDIEVCVEKDTYFVRHLKETNVITEEQCEAMRAEAKQPEQVAMMVNALKKHGISEEKIAETIAGMDSIFEPKTLITDYKYNKVTVNHTLAPSIFAPNV